MKVDLFDPACCDIAQLAVSDDGAAILDSAQDAGDMVFPRQSSISTPPCSSICHFLRPSVSPFRHPPSALSAAPTSYLLPFLAPFSFACSLTLSLPTFVLHPYIPPQGLTQSTFPSAFQPSFSIPTSLPRALLNPLFPLSLTRTLVPTLPPPPSLHPSLPPSLTPSSIAC